jgi:membrane-bound lytic murein transglycosylase B
MIYHHDTFIKKELLSMRKYTVLIFVFFAMSILAEENKSDYTNKLIELKTKFAITKKQEKWFSDALNDPKFKIYEKMPDYFKNMAENKVDNNEKDFEWYKTQFGLDGKIKKGLDFIESNKEMLKKIESINGIHYELIVSILAIETNFANIKFRGNFYVFNALVSQYILMPKREAFALRELKALYEFCSKTGKDAYFFIGSFAGACGWGQFLPSSLMKFFKDANGNDDDIDIFALDDNLYSIENYLYIHNLSGRNIDDKEALYNAVFEYNPSDAYVKGIMYLYENMRLSRK